MILEIRFAPRDFNIEREGAAHPKNWIQKHKLGSVVETGLAPGKVRVPYCVSALSKALLL